MKVDFCASSLSVLLISVVYSCTQYSVRCSRKSGIDGCYYKSSLHGKQPTCNNTQLQSGPKKI